MNGKVVIARFDGGSFALAEVEKWVGVAGRLARCIEDPHRPDQNVHRLAAMIGFRMKMIAAGYEDGNDATRLRSDPIFKMAEGALPSGRDLAPQSTICRRKFSLERGGEHLAVTVPTSMLPPDRTPDMLPPFDTCAPLELLIVAARAKFELIESMGIPESA